MNELELAAKADEIQRAGLGLHAAAVYLFKPGETTKRERELLEGELRRRGHRVTIVEGRIVLDGSSL